MSHRAGRQPPDTALTPISGPSAPQNPCKMGQDSTATTKSHTADPKGAPLATETGPRSHGEWEARAGHAHSDPKEPGSMPEK